MRTRRGLGFVRRISVIVDHGLGFVRRISRVTRRGLGFVRRIRLARRSGGCRQRGDGASAGPAHLEQCRDGPEQRSAARLLVLPEPLSLDAVVEGEPGGTLGGLGGFTIVMVLADRDQPRHCLVDDLQEPPPSLGFVRRQEPLQPATVEPRLVDLGHLSERRLAGRAHGETGQDDRQHDIIVVRIRELPAQQPDRLAGIRRLPGKTAHECVAESDPSVEQPEAAGGGGLELLDQRRRMIRFGEQSAAQLGGLVVPTMFLGVGRDLNHGGQTDRLGAVGAFELPGGPRRLLDQGLLGIIARLEVGRPGIDPSLVGVGVLTGQDDGPGAHAVIQRVEPRAALALGGLRSATLPSIATAGLGPFRRGRGVRHGRGHGGIGPRCKVGGSRIVAGGEDRARHRAGSPSYRLWYSGTIPPTRMPHFSGKVCSAEHS